MYDHLRGHSLPSHSLLNQYRGKYYQKRQIMQNVENMEKHWSLLDGGMQGHVCRQIY